MKRKAVTGLLVVLAVCSVTACGKNKASSSVQTSSVVAQSSQGVAETGAQNSEEAAQGSQTAEASAAQSSQTAEASVAQSSQTAETTAAGETQTAQTVSAAISLDEDMASVNYVLMARMISEHEGNAAFDATEQTNGDTFWKEMNYLVSAYGVNNKRISFNDNTKQYTVKKAQLRFYAAALYSDLGKAKNLPQITDGSQSVEKSGSKWQFAMNDTSGYDIAVQSCEKQEDGTFKITAYLTNAADNTALGEYAAVIKKSPYRSKKSPFHYAVVSLEKMTKMPLETVLVGNTSDTQSASADTASASQTTGTTQTAGTADTSAATTDTSASASGTTQYGSVLSMPGTSSGSDTAQSSGTQTDSTAQTSGTQTAGTSQDASAGQTAGTSQDASATQTAGTDSSNTIAGASVTSDAAMEVAKKYYGAASSDGKEYTYKFEGTTTYQNVPYYNFSVSDGEKTVINILVSGDGARVYKGTNTNGSWTMQ